MLQGMEPGQDMLAGLVLKAVSGGENLVTHFPKSALSLDPAQRFSQLFAARERWLMKDLQPFLQGLQVSISHCSLLCVIRDVIVKGVWFWTTPVAIPCTRN